MTCKACKIEVLDVVCIFIVPQQSLYFFTSSCFLGHWLRKVEEREDDFIKKVLAEWMRLTCLNPSEATGEKRFWTEEVYE